MTYRDSVQYNQSNGSNISNESRILLGLVTTRGYSPESTESEAHHYSHHISYHAHHEVLQTWHHQMHSRRHAHPHRLESTYSQPTEPPERLAIDPRTRQILLAQSEPVSTGFDYSCISSNYHSGSLLHAEANIYTHSSKQHASRAHNAHPEYYGSNNYLATNNSWNSYHSQTENSFSASTSSLQHTIAMLASRTADKIHTVGDCARGPRLTFKQLGLNLPEVFATEQGNILEGTGLFTVVSRNQVQPGDYGFRHWSPSVVKSHGGIDKGDSFIVAGIGRRGELLGANDHHFVVPADGGRYRDTTFLRPTEAFYQRYASLNRTLHKSSSDA